MTSSSNQSSGIIDTASLTWTVDNYSNTNFSKTWSPGFFPSSDNKNVQFQVIIYPNSTVEYCTDDVLVYLWHDQSKKILNLEYDVSILKSDGEISFTKKFFWNYCENDGDLYRNVTYLISNEKLKKLVQNNKLTLHCNIKLHSLPVSPNKHGITENTEAGKDAALQDYESLLENGKLSDVVLVVGKKEFHVHKQILSARSPVFSAMFEHAQTKEAQEGRVTITDVSVEVCEELLRYIYSGKIEKLKKFALDLFVVADKSLSSNITSDSVVNVLTFADMHNAQDLKQKCIDYITKKSVEVRKSESWKQLCKSKPELVVELYEDISDKTKF